MKGLDVAKYQLDIDWAQVAAAGYEWAAFKATLGTKVVDPKFAQNRAGAEAAGIRYRLAYHWITPNESPEAQVDHLLATIGPLRRGEGIMLDAEQAGITEEQVYLWLAYVEQRTGRPAAAVYFGRYVAGGAIWSSGRIFNGRRPRVFAAYIDEARATKLAAPHGWDAWQFTSDGQVPGVPARVDLDRVDAPAAFDIVCGLDVPPPYTPRPPDRIPVEEDEMIKTVIQVAGLPATAALLTVEGGSTGMTGLPTDQDLAFALARTGEPQAQEVSQQLYDDFRNKALISMGFTKAPASA